MVGNLNNLSLCLTIMFESLINDCMSGCVWVNVKRETHIHPSAQMCAGPVVRHCSTQLYKNKHMVKNHSSFCLLSHCTTLSESCLIFPGFCLCLSLPGSILPHCSKAVNTFAAACQPAVKYCLCSVGLISRQLKTAMKTELLLPDIAYVQ